MPVQEVQSNFTPSYTNCASNAYVSHSSSAYSGRIERGIKEMYAEDDLGATSLFLGNYINFGYWPIEMKRGPISTQERLKSEQDMYRRVAKELDVNENQVIAEVGSGRGVGAELILREFHPNTLIGIDFCDEQVERARRINGLTVQNGLNFQVGDAENLPFEDSSIDGVFSVEAAQHFPSIPNFMNEVSRVLKPGGKISFASFFGCHDLAKSKVSPLIQTVNANIDRLHSIHSTEKALKDAGFTDVKIQSIGKYVWNGFDRWVSQTELRNSWTRNWKKAYENQDLDYYLIKGTKKC